MNAFRAALLAVAVLLASLPISATAGKPPPELKKVSSFVTSGGSAGSFKREPQKAYGIGDTVFMITTVSWEPLGSSAGRHRIKWRWYSNGTPISETEIKPVFKPTPFELWGKLPASSLGAGAHRVEVYIDGELYDFQEFTVAAAQVPASATTLYAPAD